MRGCGHHNETISCHHGSVTNSRHAVSWHQAGNGTRLLHCQYGQHYPSEPSEKMFFTHCAAPLPSNNTASIRHVGVRGKLLKYRPIARSSRARFCVPMLAPAPPKRALSRLRTSTKTSVAPSRIMRSISPMRHDQLRSTSVSPAVFSNASAARSKRSPVVLPRGLRANFDQRTFTEFAEHRLPPVLRIFKR